MTSTIKSHLYFPNVRAKVEEYIKNCNACRLAKSKKVQCGIIPPKNEVGQLWEETAVDLMGPWEIEIINVGTIVIWAFTMIDTSSQLSIISTTSLIDAPSCKYMQIVKG